MFAPEDGLDVRGSGMTVIDWLVLGVVLLGMVDGGRNPDDPLADQGVVLCTCRKAGVGRVVTDG